jgi:hypothetical protein
MLTGPAVKKSKKKIKDCLTCVKLGVGSGSGSASKRYRYTTLGRCQSKQHSQFPHPVLRILIHRIHMFWGLGSEYGSFSQKYRSGSFYHQAKIVRKTMTPTVLLLFYDFLSVKNENDVPSKSNKQKKSSRSLTKIAGSGSAPKCHGSATLPQTISLILPSLWSYRGPWRPNGSSGKSRVSSSAKVGISRRFSITSLHSFFS